MIKNIHIPVEFKKYKGLIWKGIREYISCKIVQDNNILPWQSQLGSCGHPYLPKGEKYPCNLRTGKPLALLVQIDFSVLPRLKPFPSEGLLQIFVSDEYKVPQNMYGMNENNHTDQTIFRVIYHPNPIKNLSKLNSKEDLDFLPYFDFTYCEPYRIEPISIKSQAITPSDKGFYELPEELQKMILTEYSKKRSFLPNKVIPDVQLGGYHHSSNWQDTRNDEYHKSSILLIQIYGCGPISWGDLGTGCFFIPQEDLKTLCFKHVHYHWDCT